jgi:hypothetical protein
VVLLAAVLCGLDDTASARDLNRDLLKKGMTLSETIQAFGQPVRMEWVNLSGQAVFFLFYEAEDCALCLGPLDRDLLKHEDGRTFLPLGFVAEQLAGWGRKFYRQVKFPE